MARAYEIWSVTTGNAYAKVFTDHEEAIDILDKSRRYWPDDEFTILTYEDGQLIVDTEE